MSDAGPPESLPRLSQKPFHNDLDTDTSVDEARRKAIRDNARRVLRESGVADTLRRLNSNALQGRGSFEEYDSGVIFRWGHGYTRRHIWVHIEGNELRFRLVPHLRCSRPVPACDGEYHIFTPETWSIPGAVLAEVDRNYRKPVAEASED
ncbi:MAG TPA: hypothetical protein VFU63_04980 [Ktedonobacterales bacterium]|nr:hypothetical protein [Ktedonobacterales bacterium]